MHLVWLVVYIYQIVPHSDGLNKESSEIYIIFEDQSTGVGFSGSLPTLPPKDEDLVYFLNSRQLTIYTLSKLLPSILHCQLPELCPARS